MKQVILFSLLLLTTIQVAGQNQNIDSLENVLKTQKLTPVEECGVYKKLCMLCRDSDPEKLGLYARKVLEFTIKNDGDKKTIAVSYNFIGTAYHTKHILDSALIYYQKAVDIAIAIKERTVEANTYISLGAMYCEQSDKIKGLEYYMKALSIAENTNNLQQQIRVLGNIGGIYQDLNNYSRAEQYYEKMKTIAEKENLPDEKSIAYYYLGNVYYVQRKNLDKALEYEFKALEGSRSTGDKSHEIGSLQVIGQIYYTDEYKEYDKAEKYINESLKIAEKFDPLLQTYSYAMLADIYRIQERYEKCDEFASKAWEMDTTNIYMGRELIENIIYANIFLGNKNKAVHYIEKLHEIVNKVNDKSIHDSLTEKETKYETEKKEIRITALEKERQMYVWLGIAGGLLVISLGIALWQTMRNARKEKQLIAAKAVQDGEMGERARIAEDLHDRLGGSLSAVKIELNSAMNLQNVSDKLDECIKEIRAITHNLMPRSLLSFGMKMALEDFAAQFPNVHFHFFGEEKRIRERLEFIIYCCANELVTNSIRYSGAKEINMQLIQGEKHVSLTVQDDGCGFDEKTVTAGIGLKNIRDRVASCNGKLDIASAPGQGTETVIELKVEN